MRMILTILIGFIPRLIFGQIFPEVSDYVGNNILEIEQIGHKNCLIKNGWITITSFSNDSFPTHQINYYKGDKRGDYYYSYIAQDTIFKKVKIDSSAQEDRNYEEKRIYFNSKRQITKTETYLNSDSNSPISIEENVIRDSLNRIISYDRLFPSKSRNNAGDLITKYRFYYNKNQIDSIVQTDSENISKIVYCFKFNRKGLISDKIVDQNNPNVVLGGVRTWSKKRMDKYQFKYKYDRFGNWTKRYFVTKNWRYLDAKRKIKYK